MTGEVGQSHYWSPLWKKYPKAPSIAFCRVPELEYAASLDVSGKTLDHCCGDGFIASLAWPGKSISAGCDFDKTAIERAIASGTYRQNDVCDVSQVLPYESAAFDLVFNNSGLEHVLNLDGALKEVSRVLAPGGIFAFSVLNCRYFEWWSLSEALKENYRRWQPFHHALTLQEWSHHLAEAGLKITSVDGYFDKRAARELALLDCTFSGAALAKRPSWLVQLYTKFGRLARLYWQNRLASIVWRTEADSGAGYFIQATKAVCVNA